MRNLNAYLFATSPRDAVRLLHTTAGRGCYLAGATDLMLERRADLDFVVDLRRAGLDDVVVQDDGALRLGACVTLNRLESDPLVREFAGGAVADAAAACGNRPVRSTATLGGNICSALPSADMVPVLLALDAVAHAFDGESTHDIPLDEFFTGPRRTVLDGRLLTGLTLPAPQPGLVCLSRKLRRTAEDISLVQAAVAVARGGNGLGYVGIALGAVAPTPMRALAAEDILLRADPEEFEIAVAAAAESAADASDPIDDHRASAEYRRAMVEVLTRRLLREALGIDPTAEDPVHGGLR